MHARALAIDPTLMSAHQNLAALLAEEQRPTRPAPTATSPMSERNLLITTAAASAPAAC